MPARAQRAIDYHSIAASRSLSILAGCMAGSFLQLHCERAHALRFDHESLKAILEECAQGAYEGEGVEQAPRTREAPHIHEENPGLTPLQTGEQRPRVPCVGHRKRYLPSMRIVKYGGEVGSTEWSLSSRWQWWWSERADAPQGEASSHVR